MSKSKDRAAPPVFKDIESFTFSIESSWKQNQDNVPKHSVECQTTQEIYEFREMETQTGLKTTVMQDQVKEKHRGMTLLDHYSKKHRKVPADQWATRIADGFITVDCAVTTDPDLKLDTDFFLEFVDVKANKGTQTESSLSSITESTADTTPSESKSESKEGRTDRGGDDEGKMRRVSDFLRYVTPMVTQQLEANLESKDINKLADTIGIDGSGAVGADGMGMSVLYWNTLSVDLEKKKVIFPDWSKAKHFAGVITKCVVTRNKERMYDIEYDDGAVLSGVREEYIRCVDDGAGGGGRRDRDKRGPGGAASGSGITPPALARLQEGVRVHARVTSKSGREKWLPGRIVKCSRSTNSAGGVFDVEVEGAKVEIGLTTEDLFIGLKEGQRVDARKPTKVNLQCTGVSWNSTGNMIAVAYGRNDILGWCEYPGALCCWNIFGKTFTTDSPDFVLDHTCCLTSAAYHPIIPSLVVAGSFNGEVVVWDLTNPESPYAVSPIIEYGHKEPVMDIKWVYDSAHQTHEWQIVSVGADGKVLFWSLANKLAHPIRGSTLSKAGKSSSRRMYPAAPGATAIAFACNAAGSGSTASSGSGAAATESASSSSSSSLGAGGVAAMTAPVRPKWVMIGQEGGTIARGQVGRMLGGAALTQDSFKSQPQAHEVFPPMRKGDDTFTFAAHVGSTNSLDSSPFHRNLFLSGGSDGVLKMFHILERTPLRTWETDAPSSLIGGSASQFPSLTAVRFSPIRPTVFASASSDGLLCIYDLQANTVAPVCMLESLMNPPTPGSGATDSTSITASSSGRAQRRVGLTSLAFNPKQRDLIAGCDLLGRVHIWRLSWELSNKSATELAVLNELGNIHAATEAEGSMS